MKFILGRHNNPADAENNLVREIAGSLTVNAGQREKLSDGSFVVRDINEETAKRLCEAGLKIFVRRSADSFLSGSNRAFRDRLSKSYKSNDPDWNVIRKGDTGVHQLDELNTIYDEVVKKEDEAE